MQSSRQDARLASFAAESLPLEWPSPQLRHSAMPQTIRGPEYQKLRAKKGHQVHSAMFGQRTYLLSKKASKRAPNSLEPYLPRCAGGDRSRREPAS